VETLPRQDTDVHWRDSVHTEAYGSSQDWLECGMVRYLQIDLLKVEMESGDLENFDHAAPDFYRFCELS
jgi:hypothetical protein